MNFHHEKILNHTKCEEIIKKQIKIKAIQKIKKKKKAQVMEEMKKLK